MENYHRQPTFHLSGALNSLPNKSLSRSMENMLEHLFSLKKLDKLYRSLTPSNNPQEFLDRVFKLFNINYDIAQEELNSIPKTGPLIIVANHPFGAIEGVIMAAILKQVRPDVKIMANFLLKRINELDELFIAVNPFGGKQATQGNVKPIKEALRWLKQDGLLVVFPAGEVSHFNPVKRQVVDPQWSPTIGRLINISKSPVQTAYFHGSNSLLFHMIGMIHPLLRTALLPRELINKTDRTIAIRIGKVLPYSRLKGMEDDQELVNYLNMHAYMLRNSKIKQHTKPVEQHNPNFNTNINNAIDNTLLKQEIDSLPEQQRLVDSSNMHVYYATARQAPNILQEIGRLRELSFRAVGEGTGKSSDLDFYDNYYLHLFIWNPSSNEIVGAYRLGQVDKIMARHGIVGLYSYSLFKYSQRLIDELNPALELGRSFIRKEYQKSFSPLMLLWKGIAQYVHQNPQYSKLFGLVSISNEYQPTSQTILVDFLKRRNNYPNLERMVKARTPFKAKAISWTNNQNRKIESIDHISELISQIESDNKDIPILLKQYLKLGGNVLGFNVDKQFANALDGLIMLDLTETDKNTLSRYMGKSEIENFHNYHQNKLDNAVCLQTG